MIRCCIYHLPVEIHTLMRYDLLHMPSKPAFFHHFKRSVSDTSYYQELRGKSFWFSLRYLYFLLLLVTLVSSVLLSISLSVFISKAPGFVAGAKNYLASAYPPELVIKVANGELSTNVKEPYIIDYPPQLKEEIMKSNKGYDSFITIDTKANPDNFADYHTLILVTKKSVVYPDNQRDGSYKVQQFDQKADDKPVTINRQKYDQFLTQATPYIDGIPSFLKYLVVALLVVWPFAGAALGLLWNLLYLLFASLLVLVVGLIMRKDVSYGEVYRMSMHAMTLSILYSLLQSVFNFHVPFAPTAILVLWMIFVFRDLPDLHHTVHAVGKKKRAKKQS